MDAPVGPLISSLARIVVGPTGILAAALLLAGCGALSDGSPRSDGSPEPMASRAGSDAPVALESGTPTTSPVATGAPTPAPSIPEEVAKYLDEALDIMEGNSINKQRMDWPALRARILAQATTARSPSDAYPLVKAALATLGDRHSFFIDPEEAAAWAEGTGPASERPAVSLVDGSFGYVALPSYVSGNEELGSTYSADVQGRIREVDQQDPCGWIVDLRDNSGGNMWPMLTGVGPILGEGTAGSFVDADGNVSEWAYADGEAILGGEVVNGIDGEPYRLADPETPVAVLFGPGTASSGEAIAISFIGRPRTRSFGADSAGLSTANTPFRLSDGAVIVVTTAVEADRTGRTYGGALAPDVYVAGDQSRAGPVPGETLAWLREQPACR